MAHRYDLQLRYADTDALGHINNAAYNVYAEAARIAYLNTVDIDVSRLILARIEIDYRAQVHFGDEVYVETWVEKVGNTSITLTHRVVANGKPAAEIRSIVVYFDYEANAPSRVPEAVRTLVAG